MESIGPDHKVGLGNPKPLSLSTLDPQLRGRLAECQFSHGDDEFATGGTDAG